MFVEVIGKARITFDDNYIAFHKNNHLIGWSDFCRLSADDFTTGRTKRIMIEFMR